MKPSELVTVLAEEFDGEVVFSPAIPSVLSPPQVIVSPGDPFLVVSTHGTLEEQWSILVAVAIKDAGTAVDTMRRISLQVLSVVSAVGGVWHRASGPRRPQGAEPAAGTVISVNTVTFRYPPPANDPPPTPPPDD